MDEAKITGDHDKRVMLKTLPHAQDLKWPMLWWIGMEKLYRNLPWKKTAWTCAAFPIEIMWIYDIFPDHPENMATVAAARKQSLRLIEHAEGMGFSRDLCSYCKTNIGAYETKIKKTLGGISKPDLVFCTNAICDTHWKWFQIMADKMNVPFFMLDIPKWVSGTDEKTLEGNIDYVTAQLFDLVAFIEKHTGKKMSEKRMRKVLGRSIELTALWREIYEHRKAVPSPYSGAETSASFFPLVVLPGVQIGINFFKKVLADIKVLTAKGEGTMPPGKEKYRVMWEGIPFWYRMRFMYDLAQYGAVIAFEPYTFSFAPLKKKCLTMEDTLRDVAKIVMDLPYAYNLERRIEYFEKWIDEYKLDGVILHENMSCRPSSAGMVDLKEAIMRDKGVPVLILQGDMNDPRTYSDEQMKTRIEAFIELMEANRK
jgi:benzoyl-CoA reductase/2-hydroxyglutaryl-CoA dehydratase subunit BcrC/BadD/HgdB